MKKILLIATGGTIASVETSEGLTPHITPNEIIECVPSIKKLCKVHSVAISNIDSSNMTYKYWLLIAKAIKENYDKYDGFVITHGTDTMAYTSCVLSYLIQNSRKPIVLTGSQKSIYSEDTDAKNNLYGAFLYATSDDSSGVNIVFDGKVILGTRARKTRTKSFNAFSSIDYPDVATIRDKRLINYIISKPVNDVVFYDTLDPKVCVFKLIPGIDLSIFDDIELKYDAIVIESFGVGSIPNYFDNVIQNWVKKGIVVVITTQVPHEGSDMDIYQVGNKIKKRLALIEAYNMTLEATVTKLMWILGMTKDSEKIRQLFYTPVSFDMI